MTQRRVKDIICGRNLFVSLTKKEDDQFPVSARGQDDEHDVKEFSAFQSVLRGIEASPVNVCVNAHYQVQCTVVYRTSDERRMKRRDIAQPKSRRYSGTIFFAQNILLEG